MYDLIGQVSYSHRSASLGMQTTCPHCQGRGYLDSVSQPNLCDPGPSPVHNLVGTDQTPSPTQTATIRRVIQITTKSLSAVDEEIRKLEEALSDLQSKREKLDEYAETHKVLIAPVRNVPTELLAEIFILCLSENWQDRTFDTRQAPLLLSSVCMRWRATALSIPLLWSTLIIDSKKSPRKPTPLRNTLALMTTWLARSSTLLLNIKLSRQFTHC